MKARRGQPGRVHGLTLVEVMISASIFALASLVAMTTFVHAARSNKAQRTQIMLADNALDISRTLKQKLTAGNYIAISNSGWTVDMEAGSGASLVKSKLWFSSGDGRIDTIWDNTLRWDPNLAVTGDEEVFATGIAPIADNGSLSITGPVFTLPNGSGRGVRIRFCMGDQTGADAAKDGAHTGAGRQTFVFDSIYSVRNTKKT